MVLESQPVCLRQMLEACIDIVSQDLVAKGLEIAYLMDPRLMGTQVLGDSTRIRQVVTNLLTNAVNFTPKVGAARSAVNVWNYSHTNLKSENIKCVHGTVMSQTLSTKHQRMMCARGWHPCTDLPRLSTSHLHSLRSIK